jgi:hypothetical protein
MRTKTERNGPLLAKEWLTPDEAGQLMTPPLTGSRIKQLIHQGDLPCQKIGARHGLHLIRKADVLDLDRRRQAAKTKPPRK